MRFILCLLLALPTWAKLVRLEVSSRADANDGAYERVIGKAYFAVDAKHALNRNIVDIELTPKNAAGLVEFSADFYMLRPKAGSKTVLFEVSNRGGRGLLGTFDRARGGREFGDNFLLHEGYTLVWLGWQHDVAKGDDALRLYAPKITGITGKVRAEYVPNAPSTRMLLADSGHVPYEVADESTIEVTVRDSEAGARRPVTGYRLSEGRLVFDQPLQAGKIYDAVYTAKDPVPLMLGLAGIRDLIAHLRDTGNVRYAFGFGNSQSAMLLRALLYHGFNQDESNRRVFDGILANVAGGRRSDLSRFAQPSRTAAPLRAMFYRTEEFPFTDATTTDPVSGAKDGVLAKLPQAMVPKTMYSNSAYEYWGSSGSLLHTTADGKKDVALPSTTRVYMFSGGQHGPAAFPPPRGSGANFPSPNDYRWALRGLLHQLRNWVVEDKAPPESRYPKISDGTLVSIDKLRQVDGLRWPDHRHTSYRLKGRAEPPVAGAPYGTLVPQVDSDGNDIAGLRMPEISVPLGVYTGWNYRSASIGQPEAMLGGSGSFLPFSSSKASNRYGSREDYLKKYEAASLHLAKRGYVLSADVEDLKKAAIVRWDWITKTAVPSGAGAGGSPAR